MNRRSLFVSGPALAMLLAVTANPAAAQTFFGEDTDGGTNTRSSLTNAMGAEMTFLSFLTGVETEDFESFADGDSSPLGLTFAGAGGASLSADLQGGGAIETETGVTDGFGRYPVSGTNFWEVRITEGDPDFSITFGSPIAAFGFYGIDVGDFGGQMSLSFLSGSSSIPVSVPHTVGGFGDPDGAGFFFGYIDTANPFTQVDFLFEGGTSLETFAFDNMTIGSVEQVTVPVPEPSTMVLLGSGLVGLAILGRRRSRDEAA